MGINVEQEGIADMKATNVMDHLVSKKEALRLAAEAAITVLRVDTIIMAKQAGGPDNSRGPGD